MSVIFGFSEELIFHPSLQLSVGGTCPEMADRVKHLPLKRKFLPFFSIWRDVAHIGVEMVFVCNFPLKYKFNGNPQKFKWVQTHLMLQICCHYKNKYYNKVKSSKKENSLFSFLIQWKTHLKGRFHCRDDLMFRIFSFHLFSY